jgi:U-box domain/Sel1 repeat
MRRMQIGRRRKPVVVDLTGPTPRVSILEEAPTITNKSSAVTGPTPNVSISKEAPAITNNKSSAAAPMVADEDRSNKRQKLSYTDSFLCPITLELAIDPVHAMDGRLYDREAIMQHISVNKTGLKSPMTREKMGRKVVPAPHITDTIERMIENGDIDGYLATQWQAGRKAMVEEKDKIRDAKIKVETGDTEAMIELGAAYESGRGGLQKNPKEAFKWYEMAHKAGSVKGTAYIGDAYCFGLGVSKNVCRGVLFYFDAAQKGSDFAAHFLGMAFAEGNYGLVQDHKKAIFWLEKCIAKCKVEHMDIADEDEAHEMLEKLGDQHHEDWGRGCSVV